VVQSTIDDDGYTGHGRNRVSRTGKPPSFASVPVSRPGRPGSFGKVRIALFAASFADFRTSFLMFGIVQLLESMNSLRNQ
jgi:hypothetical protein